MISKLRTISMALAAVSIFSWATSASAQYSGPSSQARPQSVAEILKNPIDDQAVVLSGFILRKIGKEKYIFSDGTAEIRVDIDAKHFPAQKIDDKVKVEIRGEVEKEFMETPEIDVEVLIVLH